MSHHRHHHSDQEPDEPGAENIDQLDDDAFDALEDEVDRLGAQRAERAENASPAPETPHPPTGAIRTEEEFEEVVREAIADLPQEFQAAVESVVVIVSDEGSKANAYGEYIGRTAGNDYEFAIPTSSVTPNEIVIYRDTLTRDFGHDPAQLRAQIARTVRHEVAHHLGIGEDGVRELGL